MFGGGEVGGNTVSPREAEGAECVRALGDLGEQLGVGEARFLP